MIPPSNWQPGGGITLEPNALAAVRSPNGNVVVTAGPGAGKTEMLAQRAGFLLQTGTCPYPRRILAISFKVDAAKNLRSRVIERCGPELARRLDSYTFHGFAKRMIDRFRPVLTGDDALDPDYSVGRDRILRRQIAFADMVPLATHILHTSPLARNALRSTYSHVFLDEFQDCTNLQYEMIRAGFDPTRADFTAVGDTKQRIMAWAGAMEGVFERFADDFAAVPLNLYQNFRSAPRLLRVQNEMVRFMDPPAAVPDEQIAGDDGDVEILAYENSDDEARDVAARVEHWIEGGLEPSEIAILVSKELDLFAKALMERFGEAGIPYRNEHQLQDLLAEPLTQLVLDFLMVISRERQPDVFRRLLSTLVSGATDDDAEYHATRHWHRYIEEARLRIRSTEVSPDLARELVNLFASEVGYPRLASLAPDYEHGPRLDEVLASTSERLAVEIEVTGGLDAALDRFSTDRAVRVLTIHKSKGLEFHTVVVMGVERETFWGKPDEERSAYFVAVSRARRHLVVTHCDRRYEPGGWARRWDEIRRPYREFLDFAAKGTG